MRSSPPALSSKQFIALTNFQLGRLAESLSCDIATAGYNLGMNPRYVLAPTDKSRASCRYQTLSHRLLSKAKCVLGFGMLEARYAKCDEVAKLYG